MTSTIPVPSASSASSDLRPLSFVRLAGTQAEMGAQHGALAAADAARLLAFYTTMPERILAGGLGTLGKLAIRTLANAWQARLVRDRAPELVARSEAFAREVAARFPHAPQRRWLDTLATMDALQNCVALFARAGIGPFARALRGRAVASAVPACTSAMVWGRATHDGELMFARNFDFPGVGVWDAAPAFVVCAPTHGQRYGFFATRGADTPVVTVVNEAGLVLAPHTRWHRDVTWRGRMIIDLVHDIARRAETLDDAIAIARERPVSSSWGLAVGSARERSGVVIELAGPHLEVVRPPPGADVLICANRYRAPAMQTGELAGSVAWDHQSTRRERRLRALIDGRAAPLTSAELIRFLGDRVDPMDPGQPRQFGGQLAQALNVHAVVVAPVQRAAWVGVDRAPTCEGTWAEMTWAWDGPRGAWELGASDGSGFTAATRTDLAAPHSVATTHVHTAARAYEHDHDVAATRAAIERAVTAAPDDPSLRLSAAWLALEDGAPDAALPHIRAGLALETEPYRRGQLLVWGAHAARRGDPGQARRWQAELAQLTGDGVDELRARARVRGRARPSVNLMMVDAY